MSDLALIYKKGFGKDLLIVLVDKEKYHVFTSKKKSDLLDEKIERLADNRIRVLESTLSVDDGPLFSSSRKICFSHDGLKLFEFRDPFFKERCRFRFLKYYWEGYVFVGECDYKFPRICEILLICMDSFSYYGEPEAW